MRQGLYCVPRGPGPGRVHYKRVRENGHSQPADGAVVAGTRVIPQRQPLNTVSNLRLTRDMLQRVRVIGQFDKKCIICRVKYSKEGRKHQFIVAFDQHAVHERIRLEQLYKENNIPMTSTIPTSLRDSLAAAACKSAVRFGDKLRRQQCKELIRSLCHCVQPFQCAHGRPSVVPLIKIT